MSLPTQTASSKHPWSTAQLAVATGLPDDVIARVIERYNEPERYYHNLGHIQRMFSLAWSCSIHPTRAQALAILYHDAVYVPGATDGMNEQLSALLLRQHAHGHATEAQINEATRIIHDTILHQPTGDSSRLVLDLDLAGLGASLQSFLADGEAIYQEVKHLVADRQEYNQRRWAFFKLLCKRPRIYQMPEFAPLEPLARANMSKVIDCPALSPAS